MTNEELAKELYEDWHGAGTWVCVPKQFVERWIQHAARSRKLTGDITDDERRVLAEIREHLPTGNEIFGGTNTDLSVRGEMTILFHIRPIAPEPKPCLDCGCKVFVNESQAYPVPAYYVVCSTRCGMQGPRKPSKAEAILAWNRLALAPEAPDAE